jgi:hypothetical protein
MKWHSKGSLESSTFTPDQLKALAGTRNFKPFKGNPILRPGKKGSWDAGALGSMTVAKVNDLYHMYYEAWGLLSKKDGNGLDYNSLQIGHATSPDGIHWTKDPDNPVLPKSTEEGAWDHSGTWDPFVIHEDGQFKLWHGGGNKTCDWGYATSTDGTHFTKIGRISHLGNVEDDHVVHDLEANLYQMYYWDRAHEPMGLFRATSSNETDFDFDHAIELKIDGEHYPIMFKFTHVIIDDGTWYMFYGDFVRPHCPTSTVHIATSQDGACWKAGNKNVIEGHDGELVEASNDIYLLYYGPRNHFDAPRCDIRVGLYQGALKHIATIDASATDG